MLRMSGILGLRHRLFDLGLPDPNPAHSPLLSALSWAAILLWFVAGVLMATVPLSGDEVHYAKAAKAIGAFLRVEIPLETMLATVVDYGWFVPGMSLLLTPLYVFGTPDVALVRIYLLIATFCLFLVAIREVNVEFGRRYAVVLLIFPGLDITWHLFAATAWGDTCAGLVLVVVFVRTFRIARRALEGDPTRSNDVAVLELALILAFYMRGSLLLLAVAVHIFLLAMLVVGAQWRSFLLGTRMVVVGGACFCIAVAPWSFAASRTLGDLVIATSTPVLSFGITFGDPQDICFGRCPGLEAGEIIWVAAVKFSRVYAADNGISELEAQRRMSAYATRNLTTTVYMRRVRTNFARFSMSPAQLTYQRFLPANRLGLGSATIETLGYVATGWTGLIYFPGLLALMICNLVVTRRNLNSQIQSLVIKMFTVCIFLQPFLHPAHARYWPIFAPLMAISAAYLFRLCAVRSINQHAGAWPLLAIQWAYVALVVSGSLVIVVF